VAVLRDMDAGDGEWNPGGEISGAGARWEHVSPAGDDGRRFHWKEKDRLPERDACCALAKATPSLGNWPGPNKSAACSPSPQTRPGEPIDQ
jgi:hypothetical protein